MDTEIWFEVDYSRPGADDWYTSGSYDSISRAFEEGQDLKRRAGWDVRVSAVTRSKKVLEVL